MMSLDERLRRDLASFDELAVDEDEALAGAIRNGARRRRVVRGVAVLGGIAIWAAGFAVVSLVMDDGSPGFVAPRDRTPGPEATMSRLPAGRKTAIPDSWRVRCDPADIDVRLYVRASTVGVAPYLSASGASNCSGVLDVRLTLDPGGAAIEGNPVVDAVPFILPRREAATTWMIEHCGDVRVTMTTTYRVDGSQEDPATFSDSVTVAGACTSEASRIYRLD